MKAFLILLGYDEDEETLGRCFVLCRTLFLSLSLSLSLSHT